MLKLKSKDMAMIEDYLIDVELSPSRAESPLKQVEDYVDSIKSFLTDNFYSKSNIFKIDIFLNPDNIFSYNYLKAIISQSFNLFFNYAPPPISYLEGTDEIENYFGIAFQCFDDKLTVKTAQANASKMEQTFYNNSFQFNQI